MGQAHNDIPLQAPAIPTLFTQPNLDSLPEKYRNHNSSVKNGKKVKRGIKMRYAAYMRISSEEQIGNFSIDAQKRAIETWVLTKHGILAKVYVDEGHSGRTIDRPAFLRMRRDAIKKQFDALIVHKFDRLARNRMDALAMKSLLRYDLGIKVFSVSEPSEDSDGPMGALIEGVMEAVADWYSKNLAAEVAKGKKERSHQGLHNNRAPFGMTKNEDKVLIPDPDEYAGLLMAFREYATGNYSDNEIAGLLNSAGYRSKTGRPFSKDTIRDLLQNRTYLGQVKYQKYSRAPSGKRSFAAPVEWFDGQHDPVLDEDLFNRCQDVRAQRRGHSLPTKRYNFYLLQDIAYCHRCFINPPKDKTFPNYGKMRCQAQRNGQHRYYRCRAKQLSYQCDQPGVPAEIIEDQVVSVLKFLKPPEDWRTEVTNTVGKLLGERNLEDRLQEIRAVIKRMDVRWDNGFIDNEEDYIRRRLELQQELEQLTPIPDSDLQQAATLLNDFGEHWDRLADDPISQRDLLRVIVHRVYIDGNALKGLTLTSNYHLVLGAKAKGPTALSVDPFVYPGGSDGT